MNGRNDNSLSSRVRVSGNVKIFCRELVALGRESPARKN